MKNKIFLVLFLTVFLASCWGNNNKPVENPVTKTTEVQNQAQPVVSKGTDKKTEVKTENKKEITTQTSTTESISKTNLNSVQKQDSKVIYSTDFSIPDETSWWQDKDNSSQKWWVFATENGRYWITSSVARWLFYGLYHQDVSKLVEGRDFAVEVKIQILSPKQITWTDVNQVNWVYWGLIWNAYSIDGKTKFDYFSIDENGRFELFTWNFWLDSWGTQILKKTKSDAIKPLDKDNVLRMERRGNTVHFLINWTEVYSMKYDKPFFKFWVWVVALSALGADDFKIEYLD